jgi:hypothetical protein
MAANPTNSIKAALRQPDVLRGLDTLADRVEKIMNRHPRKSAQAKPVEIPAQKSA